MSKATRLPNLFSGPQRTKSARRLYEALLSRLNAANESERTVVVCRAIRRMARMAGEKDRGAFTYHWEMEAHAQRRNFDGMWRTLRTAELARTGKRLRLASHRWARKDGDYLLFSYAPLLYLRGRYRLGCKLMETALEIASRRNGWSFEWLWFVYKPVETPSGTHDVTLAHFYTALRRDLSEWKMWNKFVDDFNPKLFRASGIERESLRQNPSLLDPFFNWITSERRKRLFTGTADGERDLVEPPSKVRRRQLARKTLLLHFDKQIKQSRLEDNLRELFPELAKLLQPTSFGQLMRQRSRNLK